MSTERDLIHPAPATWVVPRRWLAAIGGALVPVVLTAAGSAVGQVLGANEALSALLIAVGAVVSAGIGFFVMRRSGQSYRRYGFRRPMNMRAVWWCVPPALTVIIILFTSGPKASIEVVVAYLVLAIAVAVNEEVWFRGIVLALLRPAGTRIALIGSSAMFGVLHLANLASGESLGATLLQVAFAILFGVVAAELVIVTGSLWGVILWHFAWNFSSLLGGNSGTGLALVGVGIACAVMLIYAARLWRYAARMKS